MKTSLFKIPAFGQSMYPFFVSGDTVYVRPISFKKIKINDFITFKKKHVFVTHRVIYISLQKNYVITKGDTNRLSDGRIKPAHILGKVVKVRRDGKMLTPDTLYHFQSLFYTDEINKINILFQKKKIDFVFLKGLPLHLYYEKTTPKRIYADCDILIEKTQLSLVDKVLRKLDYLPDEDTLSKGHKLLKNKENAVNYYKNIRGIFVTFDIHLEASFMMHQIGRLDGLYPQRLLDQLTESLLANKRVISINDSKTYPILSPTHIIIYLALHLFHHNFQGYYRYEFLNTVLQKEKFILKEFIRCIQTFKLTSYVIPVFLLLWKYYRNPKAQLITHAKDLPKKTIQKMNQYIKTIDIFSENSRIQDGIKRFYLLFLYSPEHLIKRFMVFLSPSVVYSILWVVIKKIQYYKMFVIYKYKRIFSLNV